MKLSREQKKEESAKFAEELKKSPSVFFAEYQGMKFVDLADLRAKLRPLQFKFTVVKNSIAHHAAKQAGLEGKFEELFKGPVAMVVGPGVDPVAAIKVLLETAKTFPQLKVKSAYVEKTWFENKDVEKLSKLGSRQEVLSKLLGLLLQPATNVVSVLQAPARDVALTVKAYEQKLAKQAK